MALPLRKLPHLASCRIQAVMNEFGLELKRTGCNRPVDYRGKARSAVAAYLDNEKNPVIVDVRPGECRNWLGASFSADFEGNTPAVLRDAFAGKDEQAGRERVGRYIERDICVWKNRSLAEAWGIDAGRVPRAENLGAYAHVFPWSRKNAKSRERERVRKHVDQSRDYNIIVPEENGAGGIEKYAASVGRLKAAQYFALRAAIRKKGYRRADSPDGDICVHILLGPDGERYFVRSGNHRLTVLAALGHELVPVRVCGLVRRDEAPLWPQVQRRVMSLEVAREIFDRVFAGTQPSPEGTATNGSQPSVRSSAPGTHVTGAGRFL